MKNLFLILGLVTLSLTSCSKDNSDIMEEKEEIEVNYDSNGNIIVYNKIVDGIYIYSDEVQLVEAAIYSSVITLKVVSQYEEIADEVIEAPITNSPTEYFYGKYMYSLDYRYNGEDEIILRQVNDDKVTRTWKLKKQ